MRAATVVHVRWARIQELTGCHVDLLDEHERERLTRLRLVADRDRFVLGAVLVRSLVAGLEQTEPSLVQLDRACPRCGAQHGPVRTPGRPWHCSVSHSGPFAVVAVLAASAGSTVGIDLETTCPPDWRTLLPDLLAPGEAAPEDEIGFLRTWVRKEAVVKATREGLSRRLSSVDLAAPPGQLRVLDLDVAELAAPGATAAAVAVDGAAHVEVRRARI